MNAPQTNQGATDLAADGAADVGDYVARRNANDNELTIQNLELGSGSMKQKKEKLYYFVNKLIGDEVSWKKMKKAIKDTREAR